MWEVGKWNKVYVYCVDKCLISTSIVYPTNHKLQACMQNNNINFLEFLI